MATTPTTGSELATAPEAPGFAKASSELSLTLGLSPKMMTNVLRAQCFRSIKAENVTDEMLAAFIVIANEMKVNPLLPGMMYAYPGKDGGIVPMMGPDAVFKKLQEHPEVDSWQCDVFPPPESGKPPVYAVMQIWRKNHGERPLSKTCVFEEWKVGTNPNWVTRPRHMLELRTIKQGARMIIHGIPFDEDERHIMGETNVTGTAGEGDAPGAAPTRTPAPKKEKKGAAAVVDEKKAETPPPGGKGNGNVIEGEFTEVKRAEAAAAGTTPPPADTTPPAEEKKPAEKPAEKTAPPADTAAPAEKKPRAFLQDGETIEASITVKSVTPLFITSAGVRTGSIQAKVEGDFTGTVIHIGGATASGDGLVPLPLWEPGKTVKATLLGKLNKASGQVMVRVEKAEEAAAELSMD